MKLSSLPESAVDDLEVSQTASTSGAPSLGLCTPVVYKTKTYKFPKTLPTKFLILSADSDHNNQFFENVLFKQAPFMIQQISWESCTKWGMHTLSLALLRVPALAT